MNRLTSSVLVFATLAGCAAPATRQWLDERTAATITVQAVPIVLSREDFPAGVNVRDYAELGLFDANVAGTHRLCVGVVLWSTVDRTAQQLAMQDLTFSTITLWADDQPLVLQRMTQDVQTRLISGSVLRLPSPNARSAYYQINTAQLSALAMAQHLALMPAGESGGERPYTLWRGKLAAIDAFAAALAN